ncbi:class I SAM-dependent methyltransferase [Basilea psittacipulmonis]|uniref:rRNA methyltransferase n=1 Tax=Basilea psittacipulmonis DSM 24701 TaxID=1072685 RepID=A0A077DBL1_9BURK|nr:class I SAM-dependent methyltransferase [Basilea psittacipulmonis]AIL32059.1 rRNA methyltransferase [Basilea psittacipulmonis DSM 24701]
MSSQKSSLTPILKFAHQLAKERLQAGDVAVDATMGNGHDTLMLAQAVGHTGKVYAFDVQEQALIRTQERLHQHQALTPVTLIQASHEFLDRYIQNETPKIIMFNFGYLPGADKQYTTQTQTSLTALDKAISLLSEKGLLILCIYPGHEEGAKESVAIEQWARALPQSHYQVLQYGFINLINRPPYLLAIEKLPS